MRLLWRGVCTIWNRPCRPHATCDRPGLGGANPPSTGYAQVQRVQQLQEVLPRGSLQTASQAQPCRHQREMDQHARERMYVGRRTTSTCTLRLGPLAERPPSELVRSHLCKASPFPVQGVLATLLLRAPRIELKMQWRLYQFPSDDGARGPNQEIGWVLREAHACGKSTAMDYRFP